MLSNNLKAFFPQYNNHFMCPSCLSIISLDRKEKISEAHIIPKAASGKLKTYLCSKCNSTFGSKQDKWFGEQLKISSKNEPKIYATDIKDGFFWIDNQRINGTWETVDNKNLHFKWFKDRNPPFVNELILNKLNSQPPQVTFSLSLPILRNQQLVEVGFLTAAYLMWFGAIGYSWVLQKHLELIRQQIRCPSDRIITDPFVVYTKGVRWHPWIGIGLICDKVCLLMGVENALVILPPVGENNFYSNISSELKNNLSISKENFRILKLEKPFYGPPVCVAFENKVLIMPDEVDIKKCVLLYFSDAQKDVIVGYPTTKKRYTELAKEKDTITKHLKV